MSHDNIEIVRRAANAWNHRDFDTGLSLVHPDIEVEIATGTPIDGIYRGREGLAKVLTEFWRDFATYGSELAECIATAEDVVTRVDHHGIGRSSGAPVETSIWQVCTVRAGKIVRWRNFRTHEEALKAAGLAG